MPRTKKPQAPAGTPPVVKVYWKDASYCPDDVPIDTLELKVLFEVGFLLLEDSEKIVIGTEFSADNVEDARLTLTIPKSGILWMKKEKF
jgi:hypothetical protein